MASISGSTIYPPPRNGLPHLVVTLTNGEITAFTPVDSRDEARAILAAQRRHSENVVSFPDKK